MTSRKHRTACLLLAVPAVLTAQGRSVDWPVYGGSTDHTHYSTLDQITPANVARCKVAWTYETHDEFPGSEMQNNPVVIDGVLYATTPKLRVFALDAATGRETLELRSERRPAAGVTIPPSRRRRHRRSRALHLSQQALRARPEDRQADSVVRRGRSRWTCAKDSTGPAAGLSVSASTPGVVFEDLLHHRAARCRRRCRARPATSAPTTSRRVRCAGPSTRFRIPASSATTRGRRTRGRSRAARTRGPASRSMRGAAMVFAATGSASFDFYGADRVGDDLFANTRARARRAHGTAHLAFPGGQARPVGLGLSRGAGAGDRHAATAGRWTRSHRSRRPDTSTCSTARPASRSFRSSIARCRRRRCDGEHAAETQPYPVKPPPFARQTTHRRHADHAHAATRTPRRSSRSGSTRAAMYAPADARGHDHLPGRGRRRRVGRTGVRSGDRPALRELE